MQIACRDKCLNSFQLCPDLRWAKQQNYHFSCVKSQFPEYEISKLKKLRWNLQAFCPTINQAQRYGSALHRQRTLLGKVPKMFGPRPPQTKSGPDSDGKSLSFKRRFHKDDDRTFHVVPLLQVFVPPPPPLTVPGYGPECMNKLSIVKKDSGTY